MVFRFILGAVKGGVFGGGVGYGAYAAGLGGAFNWVTYGVVGVVVGLFVGRPIWSHLRDPKSTAVTSMLKAVFGYGVCIGLYALVAKVWGGFDLALAGETRNLYNWQYILGPAIGAVYGGWLEVDDAPASGSKRKLSGDKS